MKIILINTLTKEQLLAYSDSVIPRAGEVIVYDIDDFATATTKEVTLLVERVVHRIHVGGEPYVKIHCFRG